MSVIRGSLQNSQSVDDHLPEFYMYQHANRRLLWFGFHWNLILRVRLTVSCIGSGNGLVLNRWQTISLTNGDSVDWHTYTTPDLNIWPAKLYDACYMIIPWHQPSRIRKPPGNTYKWLEALSFFACAANLGIISYPSALFKPASRIMFSCLVWQQCDIARRSSIS